MRILAFTIGQHYLGLPAEQIGSVGKRVLPEGSRKSKGAALECDLAKAMDIAVNSSERMITCSIGDRSINLYVEKIVGLVDLDDSALRKWPEILGPVSVFCGVGITDTAMCLMLDLKAVSLLEGGE